MAIQFDFDPNTFIEVTIIEESNGVRLVEIEGGMTASLFHTWQEAEANYERRLSEVRG